MRVVVFVNQLGLGGSDKAACRWARGLVQRAHEMCLLTLSDGPRRKELESDRIDVHVTPTKESIVQMLREFRPDVIHTHVPGHPHQGDVLGEALRLMPKVPVVQTNIFGQFKNPVEDSWTDFRLFISLTSCIQAARRSFQPLDENFFRRASIAVYPLDADDGPAKPEVEAFRRKLAIAPDEILLGRLSRPEPNKWTDLPIDAFRIAARQHPRLKLLLREPPAHITKAIHQASDRERFIILPATADTAELALTTASFDIALHTSITGESFGYGIAEPMNYGKPVIANSTPCLDQAQIELVRHGECGFIASTASAVAEAILKMADDVNLREKLGENARAHIRVLANPSVSIDRLEQVLHFAVARKENSHALEDLMKARAVANYLDRHQFGHSVHEQILLRSAYYRARFHQWHHAMKKRLADRRQ